LGSFDEEDGTYDLELQIDSDTGCLDAGYPRLRISTERSVFEDRLNPWLWLSALGISCCASLVVLGCWTRFKKEGDTGSALTGEGSVGQSFQWAQQQRLKPSFSGLPSFGLVGALVIIVVWLPMRLLDAIAFDAFRTRGIYVHPAEARALTGRKEPWREAVLIRIVAQDRGRIPKIFVNASPVAWSDLAKAVQRHIGRGPETTVYVTGDNNVSWSDIMNAVDVVHSLGCKVVLLTGDPPRVSTQ
jgi:biopolymer transport protein ExbD